MSVSADFDVLARIARLCVYPVKSCAGIEVQQALLTDTGLEWDRAWMVTDPQGHCLTQRTLPRMALVQPQLQPQEGALLLHAPGQPTLSVPLAPSGACSAVQVWNDRVQALDAGDAAAAWFSAFLCQPCRLVRFDPEVRRLSRLEWTGGQAVANQFADGFPLLVTSEASLQEFNRRLAAAGHDPVGIERFRPNVVLAGVGAHDEDRMDMVWIDGGAAGEIHVQPVKPCARCPIPDIDPTTAVSSPAVSDTLRAYRKDRRLEGAVTFGMNAIVRQGVGQVLRAGQRVAAYLRFE